MANRPLGLPEGSVRALIALLVVGVVCVMAFLGRTIPPMLERGFELALFGYGLVRAAQWQPGQPPPPPPDPNPPPAS